MIKCINLTKTEAIKVSLNKWGSEGVTGDCTIKVGDTESWNRKDDRGFVMTIKRSVNSKYAESYFVTKDSLVKVEPENVTVNGNELEVMKSGYWT